MGFSRINNNLNLLDVFIDYIPKNPKLKNNVSQWVTQMGGTEEYDIQITVEVQLLTKDYPWYDSKNCVGEAPILKLYVM